MRKSCRRTGSEEADHVEFRIFDEHHALSGAHQTGTERIDIANTGDGGIIPSGSISADKSRKNIRRGRTRETKILMIHAKKHRQTQEKGEGANLRLPRNACGVIKHTRRKSGQLHLRIRGKNRNVYSIPSLYRASVSATSL